MTLKKRMARRNLQATIIFFVILVIFLGIYFLLSYTSKLDALNTSLDVIKNSIDQGIFNSIKQNLSGIYLIFLAQLIAFIISVVALLLILWHSYQLYIVQLKNALVDPLIGIYNRRAVLHELRTELRRSERFKLNTCVAILDIDFFKTYNDTNGHVAGDKLLKRFKAIFRKSLRKYDIYGRYGGEEFIILFPRTKLKDAAKVCERLRKSIEKTRFKGEHNMPNNQVTVSIGLAEFNGKGKIKREILVHQADLQLYRAKKQGRNRVIWK